MSVSLNQIHQLQQDPAHTLESLSILRPNGALLLVSICPKQTGWPLAQAFIMPQEAHEATDWAMQQNSKGRNVYFTVNMTSQMNKKASKLDMTMATAFWSDCDPQVFKYKGYGPARDYLINNLVPRLQKTASFIIDSGNGIDPFFVLEQPINIDGDFDGYENLNKQIAELYEGPGTHNCDRVMRLPGTLNYPNDAKLKKGYPHEPSIARLIFNSDKKYTLSGIKALLSDTEVSNRFRTYLETHPAVAARYAGDSSDLKDKSGSAMDFSMVAMLKLGGFTKDECRAFLKDWRFGSSSDQRDTDRYWDRCWDRTGEKEDKASKADISVFLENAFSISPQAEVREKQFPPNLLKPPGVLATSMQWMLDTAQQPQPILALTASLSLAATALANKVESQTGLRTNLYLVGVADTGAGKDHGRKCIKAALKAAGHGQLLGGEEIASGQGLLSRVAREPNSLFQPDEFGLWLKSITSAKAGAHLQQIVTNLMKLFTSSGGIYTGAEYADQKIKPRVDINFPCANLHATTTPAPLFDSFSSGDITSGALNRLLILFTEPAKFPMRFVKLGEAPAAVTDWIKEARMLMQGDKGSSPEFPITVHMSEKAEKLFADFYEFWQDQLEVKRPTGMNHLWGRAWEHASKVALVVACAKHEAHQLSLLIADGQVVVSEDDAAWAIEFVKYVLDRMEVEVIDRVADSEFGQVVQATKMAMDRGGPHGLTMRELRNACRKFAAMKPIEQDAVLESLRRGEEFFVVDFKTASGRGKARTAYVSSKFREEFKEIAQNSPEGQKDE